MLANTNLDTGALIFWGAIALICIVPVISKFAYKAWRTHRELDLKHEMIARGMSVEDIERVLAAGSTSDKEKHGATINIYKKSIAETSPGK